MIDEILSRYEKAQSIIQGVLTNRVAINDAVFPHWVDASNKFWYQRETERGRQFRMVDAELGTNTQLFNHHKLADLLSRELGVNIHFENLRLKNISIDSNQANISFSAYNHNWSFDMNAEELIDRTCYSDKMNISPDGNRAVFLRGFDLSLKELNSGRELVLTDDGVEDYQYAAGLHICADPYQTLWSPDSSRILTVQFDTRNVSKRTVIDYSSRDNNLQPKLLEQGRMAYPGDKFVERYRLLSINLESLTNQTVEYGFLTAVPHGELTPAFFSGKPMAWWSNDSRRAFVVDIERGGKRVKVIEFDTDSGDTRVIFEEHSETFVKICHGSTETQVFMPLTDTDELIWFSERTGWGHLYLYDLNSGKLKNAITEGPWLVREILHYDPNQREILIQTAGRDNHTNPYYRDICKVNIDTGELKTIISGDYDNIVYRPQSYVVIVRNGFDEDSLGVNGVSADGQFLVVTRSRVNTVPESVLIDRNGKEVLVIEAASLPGLPDDWCWPEPVKLKAADKKTDIYGVVYRPPGFRPEKSYPVIDYTCSMRDYSCVPRGSFVNETCMGWVNLLCSALAALGFIVVAMEGRGTPYRNKKFQDFNYGDLASTSDFSDRVAGLYQLAEKIPSMDLQRVGITGTDAVGNSIYGLLDYPEFYKVAVVQYYMDPQYFYSSSGEIFHGISSAENNLTKKRTLEERVQSLSGKLFLIKGMLDLATSSSTFHLIDALQKYNKDFDLVCLPHLTRDQPGYVIRREWDYLVTHLLNISPPKEFKLTTGEEILGIDQWHGKSAWQEGLGKVSEHMRD